MKHRVSELEGALLDAAVAKALADPRISMWGASPWIEDRGGSGHGSTGRGFNPSTDWRDGGPIIERESIAIERVAYSDGSLREWSAAVAVGSDYPEDWRRWHGRTPLIAAMRAYVASKFGETVELP